MSYGADDEMPLRPRLGEVIAYQRDGSGISMQPDQYDALKAAFKGGVPFFEGRMFYGAPCLIKMAEVNAIAHHTPEAIAAAAEDDRREKAQQKRDELTGGG